MITRTKSFWKIARIALLLGSVASRPLYSNLPPVDWRLTVIFALFGAIFLFGWLALMRYQEGVDWSGPFSWDTPFWPITKYPFRNCLMTSYSVLLQGISGILAGVFFLPRVDLVIFFLAIGLSLQLSLRLWLRVFFKETPWTGI